MDQLLRGILFLLLALFIAFPYSLLPQPQKEKQNTPLSIQVKTSLTDEEPSQLFAEMKRVNVTNIAVQLQFTDNELPLFEQWSNEAKLTQLRIQPLLSNPFLLTNPSALYRAMSWIEEYNTLHPSQTKITSAYFVLEPQRTKIWKENRKEAIFLYQQLLHELYNWGTEQKIQIHLEIPIYFDSITYNNKFGTGTLFSFVITHCDNITLVTQTNKLSIIKASIEDELEFINTLHRKKDVSLSIDLQFSTQYATFYTVPFPTMLKTLTSLQHYTQIKSEKNVTFLFQNYESYFTKYTLD